jgi:5-oxoprolinase (ATP-hydrolysing)
METYTKTNDDGKFNFAIDRGGTFTDVHCILPDGRELVTKLLSEDPDNYPDAPTEGIRRILAEHDTSHEYPRHAKVYTGSIGSIRMGTTVATNALLERKGERIALFITKGFRDLLKIGNQSREDIFDLTCAAPSLLYECVYEVDERVMLSTFCEETTIPSVKKPRLNHNDDTDEEEIPRAGVGPRKVGVTGETVVILRAPKESLVKAQLQELMNRGIKSIAIVLAHSYTFDEHEKKIQEWARDMNFFTNISLSSQVMQMVKMVPRGHTACAAAYLTPKILEYLSSFQSGFDENLSKNVRLTFMKSDGGLTAFDQFGGHQAILSGPAGGVIGYAKTSYRHFGNMHSSRPENSMDSSSEKSSTPLPLDTPIGLSEAVMPVVGFDM